MKKQYRLWWLSVVATFGLLGCASTDTANNASMNAQQAGLPLYAGEIPVDKYSIAILPFNHDDSPLAQQASTILQQQIQNQFVQSRKFTVVTRLDSDQAAYDQEMQLIGSGQIDPQQQAAFGKRIAADYLLVGDVNHIYFEQQNNRFYDTDFQVWRSGLSVAYRILDLRTMSVVWSDNIQVRDNPTQAMNSGSVVPLDVQEQLYAKAAAELGSQSLGVIYPLTVLGVNAPYVYINEGGKRVIVGQTYGVLAKPKMMNDPTTGEKIHVSGGTIATVKILRVLPKYSIAEIVDGRIESVDAGMTLDLLS